MQDTSLEIKHLFAGSPLRRPLYAAIFCTVLVAVFAIGAYNLLWPLYGGAPQIISTFLLGSLFAAIASIPAILLVWYLDRREHESPLLLAGAAVWGAVVSTSFSLLFGTALYGYLLHLAKNMGGSVFGFSAETLSAVLATPVVEEVVKGIAILLLFWLLRADFSDLRDGLLYGAMVGLGYNAGQYAIFLLEEYVGTGSPPYLSMGALQFVFLGVNGHFVYSALLGAGFGLARQTHEPRLKNLAPIGGLVLAILANMLANSVGTKVINDLVRATTGARLLFATTPPAIVWVATAAGTLVSEFWAYILLGVAVYKSEKWEVETIRKSLFGEVNISVTPDEYAGIEKDAPFKGRSIQGYRPKVGREIVRAQNELAFRKWHVEEDGGKPDEDEVVLAWRARIASLRAPAT
ncbi:MAG: PrsW family intramembrane metalloprotease [Chloroflexi bacterium]|nr:PrsW family intramembrane metalloprotease [Chloroflexota bacterium]